MGYAREEEEGAWLFSPTRLFLCWAREEEEGGGVIFTDTEREKKRWGRGYFHWHVFLGVGERERGGGRGYFH